MPTPRYPLDQPRPVDDQLLHDVARILVARGLPHPTPSDLEELRHALDRFVNGGPS